MAYCHFRLHHTSSVSLQGGHIEHLMQKLQDAAVILDNNGDNKHVVDSNFFH